MRPRLGCRSDADTLALGHNHPVVLEAIHKVLDMATRMLIQLRTLAYEFARIGDLRGRGRTDAPSEVEADRGERRWRH
ncbi:hypothetical protein [Streptomyces bluensis]|uniref:hypothetical protein n=1 Tax=Streptomyces bluensis TaxID=33897 RepID=UPI00331A358B